MSQHLTRRRTPEETELDQKKAELAALESELVQRELDLATLQAELRNFETRYLRIVVARYAELDDLEAQIAEAIARGNPGDKSAGESAGAARIKARETASAVAESPDTTTSEFQPSDSLKKLYREVAKRLHPDLASDEGQRRRRNELMTEANRAYQEGDEATLRRILEEWEASPESVEGEGIGTDLVRVIRKTHLVQRRLTAIQSQVSQIKALPLFELMGRANDAKGIGQDLLQEMASAVETQISGAKRKLHSLRTGETRQ
jgi:hypothetical protein